MYFMSLIFADIVVQREMLLFNDASCVVSPATGQPTLQVKQFFTMVFCTVRSTSYTQTFLAPFYLLYSGVVENLS